MDPVQFDNPFEGLAAFVKSGFQGPLDELPEEKLNADTISVSTTLPSDTRVWETGILRTTIEKHFVIVENYPDKQAAIIGQAKWVKMLTEMPDLPIKDIDIWNLGKLKEGET
jgi:hypothetical protein